MRLPTLLATTLVLLAPTPGTAAFAQDTGKNGKQPQVVEPKAGEAVPQTTTSGPTGPDAPVTSQGAVTGPTGPTGPAGATTGTTGPQEAAAAKDDGGSDDTWLLIKIGRAHV